MRQACNAEGFCIGIPIAGLRSLDLPADELIAFLGLDGGNLELLIREFGDILKLHRGGGLIFREGTLIGIHVEAHVGKTLFGGCLRREDGRKIDGAGFNTLIESVESHCVFQGIKGKLSFGSQGNAPLVGRLGRPTGKVLGGVGGVGVRGGVDGGGIIRPQRIGLGILRSRVVFPGDVLTQRAELDDNLPQRLFDRHSGFGLLGGDRPHASRVLADVVVLLEIRERLGKVHIHRTARRDFAGGIAAHAGRTLIGDLV